MECKRQEGGGKAENKQGIVATWPHAWRKGKYISPPLPRPSPPTICQWRVQMFFLRTKLIRSLILNFTVAKNKDDIRATELKGFFLPRFGFGSASIAFPKEVSVVFSIHRANVPSATSIHQEIE